MEGENQQGQGQGQQDRRDPLRDLEARIDAAIDEVRPRVKRALEELDTKVDQAVSELRPRVDSAMEDVKPRIDQFISDMQPRLDSALRRVQDRIAELRRDLEDRANRPGSSDQPAGALPRTGETTTGTGAGPTGTDEQTASDEGAPSPRSP
ncbi:MAG TPA: hypothetical protein VK966_12110 [Longimicrobiales bacterium]|nr:hypothetical protein [Longimicrobiales bacterium]